jgi:serine phosphatase RsbU (regulator of sigma subunit)
MADAQASPPLVPASARDELDAELRALYAALPVGVAFLGPDLRYQRVNEELARMNGRPAAAHAGASLEEVLGPTAAALEAQLRRVMATRQPLEIELAAVPPGGTEPRAFSATFFPVAGARDELLGVGAVVLDVTERTAAEREQSRLLQDALVARAHAEAAGVRAEDARREAERITEQARRAHARSRLLAEAGRRMAESMDWETVLRVVVRSAVPAHADWAAVTVVEPSGELRVHAVAHAAPEREQLAWELARRLSTDPETTLGPGRVLRRGQAELVEDVTPARLSGGTGDPEQLRLLEALELHHLAHAPLRTPEGVIGVVTFGFGSSGRRFDREDRQLLASLAARASLAVNNARLYRERSLIAQTLQRSLLPHGLPAVPGLEIAVRYRAAGDQNLVGGDFYDVFRSGDGVWTAVIGDVSGKGAEAAAVTALVRHTLRAASRLREDPAGLLTLLNELLLEDTSSATNFCTVFYTRLCPDGDGCHLRFSNGGHPSPLLVRPDGSVREVGTGRGPLVGALDDARFAEAELRLAPGELLLLHTDGVTEVRPSDMTFGDRQLRRTLAEHAGASAEAVVAAVERRVLELQDGHPRDDIALVAVRSQGSADR